MRFPRTLIAISLPLIFAQQILAQDVVPPVAPDRFTSAPFAPRNPEEMPSLEPSPAQVLPPPVPLRTLPQLNSSPQFSGMSAATAAPKPPLSWRATAQQLRQSNTATSQRVLGKYDPTLMTLITLLPKFGYHVETLNSKAGEVLAAPADPTSIQRVIIVINEMPSGTVTIKAAPVMQGKQTNDLIQQLLSAVSLESERRGTL